MTAKQTLSASLVVLLFALLAPSSARAEPDVPEPTGEVQPPPAPAPAAPDAPEPADEAPSAPEPDAREPTGEVQPPPAPAPTPDAPDAPEPSGGPSAAAPVAAASASIPLMPKRRPTGTFEIGAGYSTDDSFIATARISQSNLFGTGKGLSMSALVSKRREEFLVRYDDPALLGSGFQLRGDLYAYNKNHPGFRRESVGGALTIGRRVAPGLDIYAGYKLEDVTVKPPDATLFTRGGAGMLTWDRGLVAALRAGVKYSSVDETEAYYPHRGTTARAQIERADERLGSDLDYTRIDATLAHHQPLGPFTLHLGGKVSTITGGLPVSERLHFDGSSDIRGYAPGAVGPKDPVTGLPLGGELLWSARAELEAPLLPSVGLSVAGFVDIGGLDGHHAASPGFGLIWRSPIGPLRFDWAYPLDGDGKPRFVFGIGGVF